MTELNTNESNIEKNTQNKAKKTKKVDKPKGWIRWSGVIGLTLIAGLVAGFVYLSSSWLLKNKVEQLASEAWGAKVEIDQLGFSFNPLGLELQYLAVTDPEQPMQNLFVIDEITLSLNLYHLVVGRFVVEDMRLTGLSLNQPRQTSGELSAKAAPTQAQQVAEAKAKKAKADDESGFKLPSLAMPSADEVLARESLQTTEQANKLDALAKSTEAEWAEIEKTLPSQQKLNQYQADIDRLFAGSIRDLNDLKQRQQQLAQLQQNWLTDKLAIEKAKQFINTRSSELSQGVRQLERLPNQDLQRLMATYSMDESGLSNMSYLLFGESVQQKLELAMDWYRKAQPMIAWIEAYRAESKAAAQAKPERLTGEDIVFVEYDPQPKFMIKRIDFSGQLDWGQIGAQVRDLNFDHQTSQKPVRFALQAQPPSQQTGLVIEGQSTNLNADRVVTTANAFWPDYQVTDWWLTRADVLPVRIKQAQNQFSAQAKLDGLSRLDLTLLLDYQNVDFDLSSSSSRDVKRYIAPAFADISRFNVKAGLEGRLLSPRLHASSDLDNQLSAAFNLVFQQEIARFKTSLEQSLKAELEKLKKPIEARLAQYQLDQLQVTDIETRFKALEQNALAQTKEAEAELQKRLDDEVKRVEREVREKIEQQQRQVEQEKKKAEQEARQKLEQELRRRLPF